MNFELNGEKYRQASAHQKEWGEKLIDGLELQGNESILDLGCGDGALTAQLADRVPGGSVFGIDSSLSMIETARQHRRNNLSFMVQDINSLDRENEFDIVFSNAALHWVKDHHRLLKNAHACLRRNGVLRFNFAAAGNCTHYFSVIRTAMKHEAYAKYFSDFRWPWFMPEVAEYEVLLQRFPFREVRVWGDIADRYFPDSDALVKWIDQPSLVPLLGYVDQADKPFFRDFVVERMIEETLQRDGTCFETFRRVNVFAMK